MALRLFNIYTHVEDRSGNPKTMEIVVPSGENEFYSTVLLEYQTLIYLSITIIFFRQWKSKLSKVLGVEQVKLELIPGAEHADPRFESPDNVHKVSDFLD